jgi:hypothetical protein
LKAAEVESGEGNLCVQFHQSLRDIVAAVDGFIGVTSEHWNRIMVRRVPCCSGGAAGGVESNPSSHYTLVEDTSVGYHMGENLVHTFVPEVGSCSACHADAENFDVNGVQNPSRLEINISR